MKRLLVLAFTILCVVLAFALGIGLRLHARQPRVLLEKLRTADGDQREALVMALALARGDAVPPMIEACQEPTGGTAYRTILLDLLFKKYHRVPDERIERVLFQALKDPDPVIRTHAVNGFAVFGDWAQKARMVDLVGDPHADVRLQVYAILTATRRQDPPDGVWAHLDEQQRQDLVELARGQVEKEADPDLRDLARSVLGREIAIRCGKAIEAFQTADIVKADELLDSALDLDPGNERAKICRIRHYLDLGEKEKALAFAKESGALLSIPRLREAPAIDGDPEETAWEDALRSNNSYRNTVHWIAKPAQGKTKTCIGHRDGTLYIAVLGYEDDLDKLVVKHTARDSKVWQDDCVEIMLDPGNTAKRFFKFAINAAGALDDGCRGDVPREQRKRNFECRYAAGIFRDRGYWACEFAVPAAELDNSTIGARSIWGMNVVRTRIGPASECCALWPTFGSNLRVELFPIAVFENASRQEPAGTD